MKTVKAWCVSHEDSPHVYLSIGSDKHIAIINFQNMFVAEYNHMKSWTDSVNDGYKVVPVEIREIKEQTT